MARSALFAFVAILALVGVSLAQDFSVFASSYTEVNSGFSSDLVSVSDSAVVEVDVAFSTEPTKQELDAIKAEANDTVAPLFAQFNSSSATVLGLATATIYGSIAVQYAAFVSYKSQYETQLQGSVTAWNNFVADLETKRDAAVNASASEEARLNAALEYHNTKLQQKKTAIKLVAMRWTARSKELIANFVKALLLLVNNSIAIQDSIWASTHGWDVQSTVEIQANITAIVVAQLTYELQAEKLLNYTAQIDQDIKDSSAENSEKSQSFASGQYNSADEVKTEWEANATSTSNEISVRVTEFVENTNSTTTTVTSEGEASVVAHIVIVRNETSSNVESSKAYVEEHVKVVVAALAGVQTTEVTVTVTATASVSGKRDIQASQYKYTTEARIGSSGSAANSIGLAAFVSIVGVIVSFFA